MVSDVIERFAKQAPAAVLFRGLFARVFADERMDAIFREYKERQVESPLLFSALLRLLTPVVSGSKPSVHAAYQALEDELGVSSQAVYDKLRGTEPGVSAALVRVPAAELIQVLDRAGAGRPDPIAGYHTFVIDGKRLDGTEHRLSETRRSNSAPLPGTVLAVLDTRWELFVDVACDPDAYACERKVVAPLLERLEAGALYLADRNFCDGPLIASFLRQSAFFVLRQHGRSPRWRTLAKSRPVKVGKDARGGTVWEQAIEVQLPDGSWQRLRRVTVKLPQPTRDGDAELHLLTNLPAAVSARAVADGYAQRWTIETCLGHLAQALNAEINTLAYPGAALLCFCLALVLFNLLSALRTLLRKYATAAEQVVDLSYYYLALEIAEAQRGLEIMVGDAYWKRCAALPLKQFVAWVQSVARHAQLRRYRKHPRQPKRPPPKRSSGKKRAHVSTHRILLARNR